MQSGRRISNITHLIKLSTMLLYSINRARASCGYEIILSLFKGLVNNTKKKTLNKK